MQGSWNSPRTSVIDEVGAVLESDRSAALATVIDVDGSAYRRPGAKMVIDEDGGTGTITVGCLEPELQDIAATVIETGRMRLEQYDLRAGDDDVWGLGVGCNGVIDILIEPITAALRPLEIAHRKRRPLVTATVIETERGDLERFQRTFYVDGEPTGATLPSGVRDAIAPSVESTTIDGTADIVSIDTPQGRIMVYVEGLTPPPTLIVCGSGHDVGPVVELAYNTGFHVHVAAFRDIGGLDARLPSATEVQTVAPASITAQYPVDTRTYAVVMSHNFVDDGLAIDALLGTRTPYIGLLGPRERFEKIEAEFRPDAGFDAAARDRIYTPAGLDLGAGSPWGIATSIVSECLVVHNQRAPRHLETRAGPIHDRSAGITEDSDT